MIARVPIRWRLTLGFALALLLLLTLIGFGLRAGIARSLDDSIKSSLTVRGDEVSALVTANRVDDLARLQTNRLSEVDESFAQIVDSSGRVLASSSPRLSDPVLEPEQLARLDGSPTFFTIPQEQGLEHRARLLAVRPDESADIFVVVGSSLEDRDESLLVLAVGLLIAGLITLVLVSVLGYLLAASALRPIDAMRRRAGEVSGQELGSRLPLSEADDEVRALGETLNSMLERIDSSMERERTFVADASHELRTPLAILKTEIDLALTGERPQHELRDALISAGEETDRLSRLATDLLVLARAQNNELAISRERLNAAELLERVVGRFSATAERDGRTMVVECDPALVTSADRLRLEQALGNLIDNALRHGSGVVRVGARTEGDDIRFQVEDEGPGLQAEFAEHAFERFTRAEGRRGEGAGLGLSIVRAIARAHGGEVEATDAPSRFTLRVPARPGPA